MRRPLVGSQDSANIHSSVPISVQVPPINLYTSVVDFIYFRRPVEEALNRLATHHSTATPVHLTRTLLVFPSPGLGQSTPPHARGTHLCNRRRAGSGRSRPRSIRTHSGH